MSRTSAGLLMYRFREGKLQALLGHPGGPYFIKKDAGAWTVIKGEVDAEEDLLAAAQREFKEETGVAPSGPFRSLGEARQKGGKVVHAWACEGDCDCSAIVSNTFTIEWPPRSGRMAEFPEIDRVEFFAIDEARRKINPAQIPFLDALERQVGCNAT
jgi:predicted NUDIX family NTP pyrophosphohydrolase